MENYIEDLFQNTKDNYYNFISKFKLSDFDESQMVSANIEIKHILEDLRSIYDYIAKNLDNKYCNCGGKIYFPYADKDTDEIKFTKKIFKKFPKLPTEISNLIFEIQYFRTNREWLLNLMDLTNNVKHVELSINKIRVERNTTYTDGETSMMTTGNLTMAPYGNGHYGVFGSGSVYVNGGHVSFYGNGIVSVGKGTIDINDSSKRNLQITYEERKILQFKLINKDVYQVLTEFVNETEMFLMKLKKTLLSLNVNSI